MKPKQRLSASVDADLMAAAEVAARRGGARNLSAWVNDALRLKLEHDRRLHALAAFIDVYEAEHGEITSAEIAQAARSARARAIPVRTLGTRTARTTRKRKAG
jgi:metal-responsive CopG/Arc/MetJ family transcriptional regulator